MIFHVIVSQMINFHILLFTYDSFFYTIDSPQITYDIFFYMIHVFSVYSYDSLTGFQVIRLLTHLILTDDSLVFT